MIKKIFLLTLIFTNACFSMNYVHDLQESWREATWLTKSAIVGFTSYILFNEWRNRSRTLREKRNEQCTQAALNQQDKETKKTNSVLEALTAGLVGTSCQEIVETIETDNYVDNDYTSDFKPQKFGGNVATSYPETMKLIQKNVASISTIRILAERINSVAETFWGKVHTWDIMSLETAKLNLGILTLETRYSTLKDGLFNHATTLYGTGKEDLTYDLEGLNFGDLREQSYQARVREIATSVNPRISHIEMQIDTLNRTLFGDNYEVQPQVQINNKEDLEKEEQFFSRHRELVSKHIGLAYQGFGDAEKIKD